MFAIGLQKDHMICNFNYLGDGVVYQTSYDTQTENGRSMPIYRENRIAAYRFMIQEASKMLSEGWEISDED